MGNRCMKKSSAGAGRKLTLALLGLDNAGKTVTTKGLIGESLEDVVPTIGFTKADLKFDQYDITLYDVGGGKNIRDIWKNYFGEVYGVIFLVDSSDAERMEECKYVLSKVLENPKVTGKPILLLGNKQDKIGALDEIDICENLNLEELVNLNRCPCRVETCAAIEGQGKKIDRSIHQGMRWLVRTIHNKFDELNTRVERDVIQQKEREKQERAEKAERVRKIREERAKKEEEELRANGEETKADSDEENFTGDDPFKRVDVNELTRKEERMKEEKRKAKKKDSLERNGKTGVSVDSDIIDRHKSAGLNSTQNNIVGGSEDEDDEEEEVPYQQAFRSVHTPRSLENSNDYNRDLDEVTTQSDLRLSMRTSQNSFNRSHHSHDSDSDEEQYNPHADKSPWGKKHTPRPMNISPPVSVSPRLPQHRNHSSSNDEHLDENEFKNVSRRAVLAPLAPLGPSDLENKKKKKKKAKRNQTEPYGSEEKTDVESQEISSHTNWNANHNHSMLRASRAPQLETHQEAISDEEVGSYDKWNLDLPQVTPSYRRSRPNHEDDDIMT